MKISIPLGPRRPFPLLLVLLALAACGGDAPPDGGATSDGAPAAAGPPAALFRPARLDATAPDSFRVRLETSKGPVVLRVVRAWAPRGADRFYNLVRAGYYDGVTFHRVVEGFVAEFGIHGDPRVNAVWKDEIIVDDPVRESNTRGRIAFAKGGPNSRTTQVFVNLADNTGLDDRGFAPFGEVVEGMDAIDALYAGYGDGPPRGEGVYKAMAMARGDAYLDAEFPQLDRIRSAEVVEGP